MSNIYYENAFACPHLFCKFKSKKYDSIESINMHWTKTHDKKQKLRQAKDHKGRLRLVLVMK